MDTTLSEILPNQTYIADGTQVTFSFAFSPLKSEYIKIYKNNEKVESGWTLGEGAVTFETAPASGDVISILREVPFSYTEKYSDLGITSQEVLDHKMVEIVAQIQGLAEKVNRAAIAPLDSDIPGDELIENILKSAATIEGSIEEVTQAVEEVTQAGADAAANIGKAEQEAIARINQTGTGNSIISKTWAVGEDYEVEEIAPGENLHSSRVNADIAMTIANEEPDVPLNESTLKAAEFIRGPKGDTGITFTPHLDSGVLSWTNDGGKDNPDNFDFNVAYQAVVAEGKRQLDLIDETSNSYINEVKDIKNETQEISNEARDWATGTITEQPSGSAKYWAEESKKQVFPEASGGINKVIGSDGENYVWVEKAKPLKIIYDLD